MNFPAKYDSSLLTVTILFHNVEFDVTGRFHPEIPPETISDSGDPEHFRIIKINDISREFSNFLCEVHAAEIESLCLEKLKNQG